VSTEEVAEMGDGMREETWLVSPTQACSPWIAGDNSSVLFVARKKKAYRGKGRENF
jgi:hypothetical protein